MFERTKDRLPRFVAGEWVQRVHPHSHMPPIFTQHLLGSTKRVGTGLAFVCFPIVFVFAFAVHPGLLRPHVLDSAELIARAHGAPLLQFAHALVTLDTALLVLVALHFMKVLAGGRGA